MRCLMKSRVWIMLLLMGILFLSGCKSGKEDAVKVGNEIPATVTTKEENKEEEKKEENTVEDTTKEEQDTMYVILKIDAGEQGVRLQNVETGRTVSYTHLTLPTKA